MNDYESRKQDRIDHYRELADNARRRRDGAYQRSHDAVAGIPFGQPILVGHHSEGRHRAALKRSDNAMRRSIEESDKAEYWERRADSAESNRAISSADPEAVAKLREKLAGMEAERERIKAANRDIRKRGLAKAELSTTERAEIEGVKRAFNGMYGDTFPPYMLQNLGGNIRRVKERIAALEAESSRESEPDQTLGAVIVRENTERQGIEVIFKGKPADEILNRLKGAGFRWARRSKLWYARRTDWRWSIAMETARSVGGRRDEP